MSDQVPLSPVQHGGGQEGGLRGGTEHVAGIVGFGAAASRLEETGPALRRSLKRWKKRLTEAFGQLEGTVINSPLEVTSDSIFHVSFSGVEAEGLLFLLARQGIQLSMGSACNASSVEPSHVVRAIGVPEAYARGSIRISLGCGMTDEDLEELIRQVKMCVQRLRAW